nr:integrase, catalytic region, zinc finger, CCHC-type, peptidase aspartic, catalytic [Tanacetum cinerariifolium]
EGRVVQMADVHTTQEFEDTHVTLTPVNPDGRQQIPQAPTPPITSSSTLLQDLPNFGSLFGFDHRLKTLEANFFEFMQTNQFAGVVSSILRIVQRYMDKPMNEAVKVAVQIQSDRLRDEAQAENEEFLKNLDENIQKIIKEQVKEQVKVQVSKILSKIEKMVNEQLEAEVLTRSSKSSKTSYVVAAHLSEMELKKILIAKIEGNKSIHRSDEQRNLYKALVKAYESDKIILDTYGDVVTLKRRRDDDADKDEEPFAESDRGSKRQREGKEPETTSESGPAEEPLQTTHDLEEPSHQEFEIGAADDQPIAEASQHPEWFYQQKKPLTPDHDWNKTLSATHRSIQPWISELAKKADSRSSFNELMNTPVDFSAFLMNRLKVDTLTPELLAGNEGVTQESRRAQILCRRSLQGDYRSIVEWHNYKHLDWITVRRHDDKLYKFKEGNLKRLRIQDIEDMLQLLNVHEKHHNLKACGRPLTRCRKLPEEAQPHKDGYVVQIVLLYLDSGCSKHMIGDRSQLINFVQKFLGMVKFGNDHVAKIMGYGDYQIGNVTISRVYYVEGLRHNLFSVGQFCDSDLEVAFRQHT